MAFHHNSNRPGSWKLWFFSLILFSLPVLASFEVSDIRVDGLRRLSAGTVYSYLPISVGSTVDPRDYPAIIRSLFATGFFTDVSLRRDGNILVIHVKERPAVAEINLSGNKAIPDDALTKALADMGLAKGRVYNPALLEKIQQELTRQYYSLGKYNATVKTTVKPLKRNRVAIDLKIHEGVTARIKKINIVGNKAFSQKTLLKQFQLEPSNWLSFISSDDQYSKQRLGADLESLSTFYQNKGYLKFTIDSTQVSITPDKRDIYITINVTEGQRYRIQSIDIAGKTIISHPELKKLITLKPGDIFSRKKIIASQERIADKLADHGYSFANINPVPEFIDSKDEIALTFIIDQGKRVYVRRINIQGNHKTQDEVLRRELRQMESSWYSKKDVDRSQIRLQRLPYMEKVEIKPRPVPGSNDLVDLDVIVTERRSGSFTLGAGYGETQGLLFNASLTQDNFLGTGNRVSLATTISGTTSNVSLSYLNPYYTLDGISRGFKLYYRTIDANKLNIADYALDGAGAEVNFGFPLNELDTINTSIGYEFQRLKVPNEPSFTDENASAQVDPVPPEIRDFIKEHGKYYHNFPFRIGFGRDSRNRTIFPTEGMYNYISGEITLPGSDLQYWRLNYEHRSYFPLIGDLVLSLKGEIGYGGGYGKTDGLPFFKHFFAGGINSVRGYRANTLGPRFDSVLVGNQNKVIRQGDGDPSGGGFLTVSSLDLQFPVPFMDLPGVRLSAFVDGGNVFKDIKHFRFKGNQGLRFSTGIMAHWLSPMGPMSIGVGLPLNKKDDDETETVLFNFGVPF